MIGVHGLQPVFLQLGRLGREDLDRLGLVDRAVCQSRGDLVVQVVQAVGDGRACRQGLDPGSFARRRLGLGSRLPGQRLRVPLVLLVLRCLLARGSVDLRVVGVDLLAGSAHADASGLLERLPDPCPVGSGVRPHHR